MERKQLTRTTRKRGLSLPKLKIADASRLMRQEPVPYNKALMQAEMAVYENPGIGLNHEHGVEFDRIFRETTARRKAVDAIKLRLRPPTESECKTKKIGRFRKWLRERGKNPDRVTTGGSLFKKFVSEERVKAVEAQMRAEKVIHLLDVELWGGNDPVFMEASAEQGGWNGCLYEYIYSGDIPRAIQAKKKDGLEEQARVRGYNAAQESLIKLVRGWKANEN